MNSHQIKTDNTFLKAKIDLRLAVMGHINKNAVSVLDAYSGDGVIWDGIRKLSDKKLNILRIDSKQDKKGIYLKGDNKKFLNCLKLSNYDIIDLDSYGVPFEQCKIIFRSNYKGWLICTFIQSQFGKLNKDLLLSLGYTDKMISKIPTIFNRHGMEKMMSYLYLNGIEEIVGCFFGLKNYFAFNMERGKIK